ncbi:MAG: hypothetical protein WAT39_00585 [Planctomycetota bacterium]
MSFLSELRFASALVYTKNGSSTVAEKSRRMRDSIKRGDPVILVEAAKRLAAWLPADVRDEFLGPDVILIPAPGSTVLGRPPPPPRGQAAALPLWIPLNICRAMREQGLGAEVWEGLRRTKSVPKSAFAGRGERPTLQLHYETMACTGRLFAGRVTIVDDFVTKGRTLLAAATRVSEALPQAEVRAFALVRTMNFVQDIEKLVDPCVGAIRCVGEDAVREP